MALCLVLLYRGVASGGCILKDEKTFFKQFKKPLILFCNPQELMAYSDCNESSKDDTLLLK